MEQAVACYREHGVEPPADLEKRLVVVGAFLDGLVFYTGMDPEFEPKTVLPILTDILLYLEKNDGKPSAKGKAEKEDKSASSLNWRFSFTGTDQSSDESRLTGT